jgi:hypothetical protein
MKNKTKKDGIFNHEVKNSLWYFNFLNYKLSSLNDL